MKKIILKSAVASLLVIGFVAVAMYVASAHSDDSVTTDHDHLHHHHFAEFARVPEKARARLNPLESDPEAVAAGKKLFGQHCAECHGSTAEGSRKAPNLRAEEVQQATPGTLFWILTNGVVRRGMPVWSKLPEPQRWQIITFLKSLGPWPTGQPKSGHDHSHPAQEPSVQHNPPTGDNRAEGASGTGLLLIRLQSATEPRGAPRWLTRDDGSCMRGHPVCGR